MTPAAKQFIESTVQALKARMFSPQYQMLMRAETINTDAVGMPAVVFKRDMMLLGSVLLREEPADETTGIVPDFYLDSTLQRLLIAAELRVPIREFVREAHVGSWDAVMVSAGSHRGSTIIPRRFYTTNRAGDPPLVTGWVPKVVPTRAEKEVEGSTVPVDAITLPDFEPVTDQMRYSALGL